MTFKQIGVCNIFVFLLVALFTVHSSVYLLLTIAQLVFVPLMIHLLLKDDTSWQSKVFPYIGIVAYSAVVVLQVTDQTSYDTILAAIYLIYTMFLGWHGLSRFVSRGFSHTEELVIDVAFLYIPIGGMWFFASETTIDTGFSPMITWLTGIHFHYAAFLLLVFIGLVGRLYKSNAYKLFSAILVISPIVVALGITFSVVLELVSVILYIIGIYGFIFLSFHVPFITKIQKIFVHISLMSLGVSIVFSLIYAFGNVSNLYTITIPLMLATHGVLNAGLFAFLGVVAWYMKTPTSNFNGHIFPVSKIVGGPVIGETILPKIIDAQSNYEGLVDSMDVFHVHSKRIKEFYEKTNDYRLYARVYWHTWFLPFAYLYKHYSQFIQQINLPVRRKKVEMTGDILSVKNELDGRDKPRVWIRKVNSKVVFVAIYSVHEQDGRTYMNISLPLPWSSMVGILEVIQQGDRLVLTSRRSSNESNAGVYMNVLKRLCKLPLEESFYIEEKETEELVATHYMQLFSIPFLTIHYTIEKK